MVAVPTTSIPRALAAVTASAGNRPKVKLNTAAPLSSTASVRASKVSAGSVGSTNHDEAAAPAPSIVAVSAPGPARIAAAAMRPLFVDSTNRPAPAMCLALKDKTDWGATDNPSFPDRTSWIVGPCLITVMSARPRPSGFSSGLVSLA